MPVQKVRNSTTSKSEKNLTGDRLPATGDGHLFFCFGLEAADSRYVGPCHLLLIEPQAMRVLGNEVLEIDWRRQHFQPFLLDIVQHRDANLGLFGNRPLIQIRGLAGAPKKIAAKMFFPDEAMRVVS